jgi:hypothetical protein
MKNQINRMIDRLNKLAKKEEYAVMDKAYLDKAEKVLNKDVKPLQEIFFNGMLKALKTSINNPSENDWYKVCSLNAQNWYELPSIGKLKHYFSQVYGVTFKCECNAHNIPTAQYAIIRYDDPAQKKAIIDGLQFLKDMTITELTANSEL